MVRQSCSDAQFWAQRKMQYEKVLGRVLRNIRLQAGIRRSECVEILTISNLSQVENGLVAIRIDTLVGLCEVLGVALADVLLVVEARLSDLRVEEQLAVSNARIGALLAAGKLEPVDKEYVRRGVKGQRADSTRDAVIRMQGEGVSKEEIARKLGVGRTTVYRYWVKVRSD